MHTNIHPPLLSISKLSIHYPEKPEPAVNDVDIDLFEGQISCLLGPSGCGKTSLLRAIAGFVPSVDGTITLNGQQLNDDKLHVPAQLRRIGFMFQDLALFQHLTVKDNIAFGLNTQYFKQSHPEFDVDSRVQEVMSLTQITNLAKRFPSELSGGQQQRVALARALAPMPKLLLLDEPFSSLDAHLRRELADIVKNILKTQNMTALMVTHDQHEAFAMADYIGLMKDGALQQWDTPYALYHQPKTRFVAQFIGEGSFLPRQIYNAAFFSLNTLASSTSSNMTSTQATLSPITATVTDEDILLRPDDVVHDDLSKITAQVIKKSFRGAQFLYTLRTANNHEILALVPSHHNHQIGEWIGIRLEVDHLITFASPAI